MTDIIRFKNINQLREDLLNADLDKYALLSITDREIIPDANCDLRMRQCADDLDACLVFSSYRLLEPDGTYTNHPGIEYQPGSLRDDFDLGGLVLVNVADVIGAVNDLSEEDADLPDGGWYALRLSLGMAHMIAFVPETLYTMPRVDMRKSGEKQHGYVDPRNRDYQIAMEKVLIDHLRTIGALTGPKAKVDIQKGDYPVMMSVVIPVRNRVKTIGDAVHSALSQVLPMPFNVIVVDNGSTDGTSQVLDTIAATDSRLIVPRPDAEEHLGIGGCWNKAVTNENCGRFVVQLDSDDVYNGTHVLSQILECFYKTNCAAVVGNSSSALTEAPSFGIPSVDIGNRQKGRAAGSTVIHCNAERQDIAQALEKALSADFRNQCRQNPDNPYFRKGSLQRIASVLTTVELPMPPFKEFYEGNLH